MQVTQIFIRFGLTEGDMSHQAPVLAAQPGTIAGLRDRSEAKVAAARDVGRRRGHLRFLCQALIPRRGLQRPQLGSWLRGLLPDSRGKFICAYQDLQPLDPDAGFGSRSFPTGSI